MRVSPTTDSAMKWDLIGVGRMQGRRLDVQWPLIEFILINVYERRFGIHARALGAPIWMIFECPVLMITTCTTCRMGRHIALCDGLQCAKHRTVRRVRFVLLCCWWMARRMLNGEWRCFKLPNRTSRLTEPNAFASLWAVGLICRQPPPLSFFFSSFFVASRPFRLNATLLH